MSDIGYLGCSNTSGAVRGYTELGGQRIWPGLSYGGGDVKSLKNAGSSHWTVFNGALGLFGQPVLVWLQLCARPGPAGEVAAMRQDAEVVLGLLWAKVACPIEVSGLSPYEPGFGGAAAWQNTITVAGMLVDDGLCVAGSPLVAIGEGTTRGDKTHPSAAGELVLGQALLTRYG